MNHRRTVARKSGYLARNVLGPARGIKITRQVFTNEASQNGQRITDKQPDGNDENDGRARKSLSGVVHPGNRVLNAPHDEQGNGKEAASQVNTQHPS